MSITIKPKPITKENFKKFGDMITTDGIKPLEINEGYANRYDGIANLDTKKDNGESTISIFSALKRSFPMKVDMMEKHPLGSQAFIPMKETTFLACHDYMHVRICADFRLLFNHESRYIRMCLCA